MQEQRGFLRGTVTGKVLFIGLLILLLLVPMRLIEDLIRERSSLQEQARAEIGNTWGNAQTIGGPMLVVPFRYTLPDDDTVRTVVDALYVMPETLSIEGTVEPQVLRRGIYQVPVYTAQLEIGGVLPAPSFDAFAYENLEVLWNEAQIVLPLTDPRPIRTPVILRLGDAQAEFEAGGNIDCTPAFPASIRTESLPRVLSGAVPAPIPAPPLVSFRPCNQNHRLVVRWSELGLEPLTSMQSFSIAVDIRGTGRLHFLGTGDVTTAQLDSQWPSPSFSGAFLPERRSVSDAGFAATWRVLGLGRGYPSEFRRSDGLENAVFATSFGVDLIVPVGVHEASLRAAKYALLFLGITFLVYFLFETFAALRLHALQYLAVGMANCLFFLLLLAIAEHVGFGWAYTVSAIASTLLIGGYSAAILRRARRALPVVTLLAGVYSYLYVTLKAEDFALLFGAGGLFAILAAFMWLTRRVDWFDVRFGERSTTPP